MMNPEDLDSLIEALIHQRGLDPQLAEDWAIRHGDIPETDESGLWPIRDASGQIITRIQPLTD